MWCSSQGSHLHHAAVHFREVLIRTTAKNKGIGLKEGLHTCNGDSMSEGLGTNTFINNLCNVRDELGNMGEIINEDVLGDDVYSKLVQPDSDTDADFVDDYHSTPWWKNNFHNGIK